MNEHATGQVTSTASPADHDAVVDVRDLWIRYGPIEAVRGVSFTVRAGQIVGLVGRNGAGKTSIVEAVGGLRSPVASGTIRTCGIDALRDQSRLRSKVGMQLQESAFPSRARVGEICDLYERIYRRPGAAAGMLASFGLADRRRSFVSALSGGLRQRLALVLAQIGDIELVILDELTTGLDPEQRRSTWQAIRDLAGRGVSVLLTSHFMDEVEALCGLVGVLVNGMLVCWGTPSDLIEKYGGQSTFSVDITGMSDAQIGFLRALGLPEATAQIPNRVDFHGTFPEDYESLIAKLHAEGLATQRVKYRSPSFDDAYLRIVNGALEEAGS